jgi:hypothetical protein
MEKTAPPVAAVLHALTHAMSTSPSRWLPWGLVLTVCLIGCAETTLTYTPLNLPPRALKPRAPEQLQIFSSAPSERPHVDVALISVQEGSGGFETPATLIEALRQNGAARGCDALQLAPPSVTTKPTGLTYFDGSFQVYSATCIVYTTTEPGDATATFAPPQRVPDQRRICLSQADFDQHRNCVLEKRLH